ncbi:MAG: KAP family NTPase, partial [Bryobacter sp.]|nr:KAP family NTPase [Bryobacter sp.]
MSSAPDSPLLRYDSLVGRAVQLAARIGRHGRDGVDVSYTSLFIAVLVLEDETGKWLSENASPLGANLDAVLKTREVTWNDLPGLREAAFSRDKLDGLSFSPSARRVLAASQEIADETSSDGEGVVATRHIASVYFFRNPPDHQPQLEQQWRFDPEKWRTAFLAFVTSRFTSESAQWEPVFAPYFEPASLERLPFVLSSRYRFARETDSVLGNWWGKSDSTGQYRVLRLVDLVRAGTGEGLFSEEPLAFSEGAFSHNHNAAVAVEAPARLALDAAQSLAYTTTEDGEIHPRHLAASLLLDQYAARLAAEQLRKPPAVLRRELLRRVHRDHLSDDPVQWRKALITDREPDLAVYRTDNPETGDDQLDVRRFAAAFALLISSTEVKPPLAIGISGNWGSGKSFFMRLMREETRRITALAQSDARFHSSVVPIEFNAWHYAEKDLLASLVQEIFKALEAALIVPDPGPTKAEAVLSQLAGAKAEREGAAQEMERAQSAVEEGRRQLEETRRQAALRADEAKLSAAEVAAANAPLLKEALAPL